MKKMREKSYAQKAAVYYSVIRANPKTSANSLGRRYAGTNLSLRKQDRNDLVKALKDAVEYDTRLENSDAIPQTKTRLKGVMYLKAKHQTRYTQRKNPDPVKVKRRTIREVINDTFTFGSKPTDRTEFYGP